MVTVTCFSSRRLFQTRRGRSPFSNTSGRRLLDGFGAGFHDWKSQTGLELGIGSRQGEDHCILFSGTGQQIAEQRPIVGRGFGLIERGCYILGRDGGAVGKYRAAP